MTADSTSQPGTADAGINLVKGGWFTELSTMWPGQGLSIQIDEILFKDRSDFQVHAPTTLLRLAVACRSAPERACASQDVCIFSSKAFGKVMLLDGTMGSLLQFLTRHCSLGITEVVVSLHQLILSQV